MSELKKQIRHNFISRIISRIGLSTRDLSIDQTIVSIQLSASVLKMSVLGENEKFRLE